MRSLNPVLPGARSEIGPLWPDKAWGSPGGPYLDVSSPAQRSPACGALSRRFGQRQLNYRSRRVGTGTLTRASSYSPFSQIAHAILNIVRAMSRIALLSSQPDAMRAS